MARQLTLVQYLLELEEQDRGLTLETEILEVDANRQAVKLQAHLCFGGQSVQKEPPIWIGVGECLGTADFTLDDNRFLVSRQPIQIGG